MKLDHLPIDVLHALQEVATETAKEDREVLRRRNAGLHMSFPAEEKRRPAPHAGPSLPMGPDDERRVGKVIIMEFGRQASVVARRAQ